jgi:uncharacterized protein involved in exopolysaccharide biosynthesis
MVQLTQQQIEQLKELENHHALISQEIERAKTAGLNMSEYEQKLAQLEATRQGLLKVYGGARRRRTVG